MKIIIFKVCTVLLLAACVVAGGCSDSNDNGPTYNLPEGLNMYALEAETGALLQQHAGDSVHLLFYGEPATVYSLEQAVITVHSLSDVPLSLRENVPGMPLSSTVTVTKIWTECPPNTELPHIESGAPYFPVFCSPSEDSQVYDFYLEIENPEKGISFRTPNYRITIHYEYEGQDVVQDSYKVTFETIQ